MKIGTKFNIGQTVCYIHPIKKVIEFGVISRISIDYYDEHLWNFDNDIGYQLGTMIPRFSEDSLFATREEAEAKLKELKGEGK